jgi:hypothetical protein
MSDPVMDESPAATAILPGRRVVLGVAAPPAVVVPGVPGSGWPDEATWALGAFASLDHFHAAGASGPMRVGARLLHDGSHRLLVRFEVRDERVVARHLLANADVCQDSCVEVFLSPPQGPGHFNVEVSAIGTPLLMHVIDPSPPARGSGRQFAEAVVFEPAAIDACLAVRTSLPAGTRIDPPTPSPIAWHVEFAIDLRAMLAYRGLTLGSLAGTTWRGNLYKCADAGPLPHWAAWADIGSILSFHQPARFGVMHFA